MLSKYIPIIKKYYHARDHNHEHYKNNNLGFGFIHYAMIRNIRPEHVLCIGSQRGFVPAICALACKHNDFGHVDFVDAGYEGDDETAWGGVGIWKTATTEYWFPLEVEDYITLHNVRTDEFKPNHGYQYAYIDGDHSYEGIKRDYELFKDYVRGFTVFHDVSVEKETKYGKCGVKRFWDELEAKEKLTIPFSAGLGIIRE